MKRGNPLLATCTPDSSVWYLPIQEIVGRFDLLPEDLKQRLVGESIETIIPYLSDATQNEPIGSSGELELDWMNGRRTPDTDQNLSGVMAGLNLGSTAPKLFRALVEAYCFGAKKIVDRFLEEDIPINGVIALGGVAQKAPFIMQMMADVLKRPIKVSESDQTCALGASIFAAVAAGIYEDVPSAVKNMGSPFGATLPSRFAIRLQI